MIILDRDGEMTPEIMARIKAALKLWEACGEAPFSTHEIRKLVRAYEKERRRTFLGRWLDKLMRKGSE